MIQKKMALVVNLLLFFSLSNAKTYICTGMYCDQENEDSFYPYVSGPLNKPSSSEEFQAIYWQCVCTLFATSYRHNQSPDITHILFTNKATLPERFAQFLHKYNVETIQLPLTYATPHGYYHTYRGTLYRLDMIQYLGNHCTDNDTIILLDSDCIWLRPFNDLQKAIHKQGVIAYLLPFTPEEKLDGISRIDLQSILNDIKETQSDYLPPLIGGELIAAKGNEIKRITQELPEIWKIMLDRFGEKKLKFNTDEHFLSYVYTKLGYISPAMDFLQRIYTNKTSLLTTGHELEKTVWHLPSEKTEGIRALYNLALDSESIFWSTALGDEFRMLCAKTCHVLT